MYAMNRMDSLSKIKKDIFKNVKSEDDVLLYSKAMASFIDGIKKHRQPTEIVSEVQHIIVNDLQKYCGSVKGGSGKLSRISESESDNSEEREKAEIEQKFSFKADDNEVIRELKENAKNFNLELWDRAHRTNKGSALSTFDRKELYCRVIAEKHLVPSVMNVILITTAATIVNKLSLLLTLGPEHAVPTFVEFLQILSFCRMIQQMIQDIKSEVSILKFRGKLFENETNSNVQERETILVYLLRAEEMLNDELKAQAKKAEREKILQGARSVKASRLARNFMTRNSKARQKQQESRQGQGKKGRGGTRKN